MSFKDSPFAKVGHHFLNNARIANESFSLVQYLRLIMSDTGRMRLTNKEFHDTFNNITHVLEMELEAAYLSASAGYSSLKLDVRKTSLVKFTSEEWLKEDLLGSPFNTKELFGPIPECRLKKLIKNPDLRAKQKPAIIPKSGRGRGQKQGPNNAQTHWGQGRGFNHSRGSFPRGSSNRGGTSSRGNYRGRGYASNYRGKNVSWDQNKSINTTTNSEPNQGQKFQK